MELKTATRYREIRSNTPTHRIRAERTPKPKRGGNQIDAHEKFDTGAEAKIAHIWTWVVSDPLRFPSFLEPCRFKPPQ
jgi:hypothetical protein